MNPPEDRDGPDGNGHLNHVDSNAVGKVNVMSSHVTLFIRLFHVPEPVA
jgi:hypothetical protein